MNKHPTKTTPTKSPRCKYWKNQHWTFWAFRGPNRLYASLLACYCACVCACVRARVCARVSKSNSQHRHDPGRARNAMLHAAVGSPTSPMRMQCRPLASMPPCCRRLRCGCRRLRCGSGRGHIMTLATEVSEFMSPPCACVRAGGWVCVDPLSRTQHAHARTRILASARTHTPHPHAARRRFPRFASRQATSGVPETRGLCAHTELSSGPKFAPLTGPRTPATHHTHTHPHLTPISTPPHTGSQFGRFLTSELTHPSLIRPGSMPYQPG